MAKQLTVNDAHIIVPSRPVSLMRGQLPPPSPLVSTPLQVALRIIQFL